MHAASGSPSTEEALRRIAQLYAIEQQAVGMTPVQRRALREQHAVPDEPNMRHLARHEILQIYEIQGGTTMVTCTDQGERMEGSFVETAYTNEQVTDAIEAGRKLGLHLAECAFLSSDPVSMRSATLPSNGKSAVKKRNSHLLLDDRKLWVAQAVLDAADLKTIRAKSLSNLTRWRSKGTWGPAYDEWWQIMTSASDAVLIHIMTSQADEPNRLRQSMPYTGLLSQETLRRIRILYCAACAENDELEDE